MSLLKQALSSLFGKICHESHVSLNFCILSLLFANAPQARYVNPNLLCAVRCLKCISGITLCPANKNVFTISFILDCIKEELIKEF